VDIQNKGSNFAQDKWIEFKSGNQLLKNVLQRMLDTYLNGGEKALRNLNKPFDRQLKIRNEEYFPLALYVKKCFSYRKVKKIFIPTAIDNEGFDAILYLDQNIVRVEITSTRNGDAINHYFKALAKQEKPDPVVSSLENEIELIKKAIENKVKKGIYKNYRPILVVEFDINTHATCSSDQELNQLEQNMLEFVIGNQENLREQFLKIVLVKSWFSSLYQDRLYQKKIVELPKNNEDYKVITFTFELENVPTVSSSPQSFSQHIYYEIDLDRKLGHMGRRP